MLPFQTARSENHRDTTQRAKTKAAELHETTEAQRGKAATKGKELTQKFSQEETERTEKKKERARGKGKRILTTETQRRENEANIILLKMKSFETLHCEEDMFSFGVVIFAAHFPAALFACRIIHSSFFGRASAPYTSGTPLK